jgi:methyltransferase (TIGR00027 family)
LRGFSISRWAALADPFAPVCLVLRPPLRDTRCVRRGQGSRTAEYMALFRALESARPAPERLFADTLAAEFLSGGLRAVARAGRLPLVRDLLRRLIDRRWRGPRPSAVVRTRLIDDALVAALAAGVEQVVILGAGYDSRAYRLPGAASAAVFEVDHPDTQATKRRVLERVLGGVPPHVRLVALDFEQGSLAEAMADAGLVAPRRTFVLWEGVASYLTPAAVAATLDWAAAASGPGSELLFTYVHRGVVDGSVAFAHADAWIASVRRAGEPFVFGFDPATLAAELAGHGWELVDDVSTTEALVRYGLPSAGVPAFYRLARARR